jgi:hypothetical protein
MRHAPTIVTVKIRIVFSELINELVDTYVVLLACKFLAIKGF